jgi:magnesium-transporting ATPase (P-type)
MFKKIFKFLNPVEDMKKIFHGGREKQTEEFLRSYKQSKIDSLRELANNREYVDEMSFEDMLLHWGIDESQIEKVISGLFTEVISVFLVWSMILLALALQPNLFYTLTLLSVSVLFIAVLYTRLWRISCLKHEQFTPIKKWWLSGCKHQ